MPSHTCVEGEDVDDAHIEDVVNVEDEVRVDVDVNVEDGGRVDDGVNLISSSSSGLLEPFIGMEFDDVEDVQAFYKAYARRNGFAIRTNHTRLSKEEKKLIAVDYVCSREGFRRERSKHVERTIPETAETKIGCKAIMGIKKESEKWIVCKFVMEHNHGLLTPRSTSFLRGHRGVTRVQKKLIMTLNESGVPTRKIMSVLSKESGGDFNIGCIGKDVENYLGNKRKKLFEEGDAQRLYTYFLDRQCKEPGFVYSMQVDENGCMGSCFWADARSRAAYQYFGDMPFVPFSGVNHHHQTIMFGCALLVNETAESYVWLLRTWQEAMLGPMAKAIVEVLPNTTHRLCLWHILQKFPEHLAHVYNRFPEFGKDFRHCIHETITIEEFEQAWSFILVKYALGDNAWLQGLYNRREKWVPAYLRSTFCAGMSTTQRSESMNKFFKDYVRSSTMVSDFVHQYEKALDARYFKKEKDVRTKSTRAILKTGYKIEEEAAIELFNSQRYKSTKCRSDCESKTYGVTLQGKETPIYYVTLESGQEKATCTCHMFEFKFKLDSLSQHYVLERWTVKAKSRPILEIPVPEGHLMMQFYDVAELASKSPRKLNHLSLALEKVTKEFELMDLVHVDIEEATGLGGGEDIAHTPEVDCPNLDA
ncbi:hypothetical protein I3760_14G033900 [Carya illinoinensis]|nr:hypothetical protein I3760_14G033900 [Carya illinoinensis]